MFLNNLKGDLDSPTTSQSRIIIISLIMISLVIIFTYDTGNAAAANNSVIYVNGSHGNDVNNGYTWTTAKLTIKNATGTVNNGGTVNIAQGTYTGTDNTNINITKNMTIIGANQNNTIINAQGVYQIFNINPGVTVTLQNLTLTNGYSYSSGGAIDNEGKLTVSDSTFAGNTGTYGSGAIYNRFGGTVNVTGSKFTGNIATNTYGMGGAIFNYGALILSNSTFTQNTAGAIYNVGGNLAVTSCNFTNNIYSTIYNIDGALNVTGCNFTNNTGGAIDTFDSTANVINCSFTGNTATSALGGGGAIENSGALTVSSSTFTNNTFTNDNADSTGGGAIYNYGNLTVTGSHFTGNNAIGTYDYGGAILNSGALTVSSSTFNNNTAYEGGAILNSGSFNVTSCNFTGNNATSDYSRGGAILNYGTLNVTNSLFTGNTASDAGAIYSGGSFNVTSSTFTNNTAGNGGAIYNVVTATVRFNRIIGNSNYDIYNVVGSMDALYNWWGTNFAGTNPVTAGRINSGNVTSWIVLTVSASPTTILPNGTSKVTADLLHDNNGVYHDPAFGVVPYTGLANFKTTLGSIADTKFSSGLATSTFNAGTSTGVATVSATVDQATVNTYIIIGNTSPTVVSVDPVNNTVNVPINKVIKVTFSEPLTAGSAYSLITVKNSAGAVKMMTSSISGSVLTLTPVYNYLTEYKYTLNLPVNSVKDLAGNNLLSAYTSSFTVTPLTVNSTDPANNTVNVTTNKVIKITFNELIQQGSAYSQITVKNSGGVVKLMNASVSGSVLTLTPVYNYLTGDRYTVNLPVNSVKDSAGNGLATAYNSTFNTK